MAKTDKTRPWWVRAAERPFHTCVPVHQHENGVCDLPAQPREVSWGERDRCYWTAGPGMFYGGDGGCGCRMCTGQEWRRAERRAHRRAAAKVCRDAARSYHGDAEAFEDYDDYVPSPSLW